MTKHLHIISFTVPYPVDHGGVYDLFYKLTALQSQGVMIHLHCFDYGRGRQHDLEKFCHSVDYYDRNHGHKGVSNTLPYIVSSRKNEQLFQKLLQDDHPILMEGIHCTYLLTDDRFKNRKCFVRLHNVEYLYYRDLGRSSKTLIKKLYYWLESRLLIAYEKKIAAKAVFWSVTEKDATVYRKELNCPNITHIPLFLPAWEIKGPEGMGTYCLYHGDLEIEANERAAIWLVEKVFKGLNVPFIIAGKEPSEKLVSLLQDSKQTCLIADPSEKEMQDVIEKAHIHILPSYTNTGIKLKLLNSVFNGRHCIVNPATVNGSGLEAACHTGTTVNAFRELIVQLYHQPFTTEEINLRKRLVQGMFDNERGATRMISAIWS